jgi:hypothetical protein
VLEVSVHASWLHCFWAYDKHCNMVVVCDKQKMLNSWWTGSREGGSGQAPDIIFKGRDLLPLTRPYLLPHLPIMPSNYESMSRLIHRLDQSSHDPLSMTGSTWWGPSLQHMKLLGYTLYPNPNTMQWVTAGELPAPFVSLIRDENSGKFWQKTEGRLWKWMHYSWQGSTAWTLTKECFLLFAERILKWALIAILAKLTLLWVKLS